MLAQQKIVHPIPECSNPGEYHICTVYCKDVSKYAKMVFLSDCQHLFFFCMWNRASGSVAPEPRPSSEVGLEQSCLLKPGLNQLNPPVIRRERQRHSDRPRSHSASGLAASVGLPCPFSSSEWLSTNKTQCQPNLDVITFPGTVPKNLTSSLSEMDNQNSANANISKDAPNDSEKTAHDLAPSHQEVAESLTSVSLSPPHRPSHSGLPTSSKDSISPRSLPSRRISESCIGFASSAAVSQENDGVFLTPTSPLLHPLSSREGIFSEEHLLIYPSAQPQTKEEALDLTMPQESQKLNRYKHTYIQSIPQANQTPAQFHLSSGQKKKKKGTGRHNLVVSCYLLCLYNRINN